MSDSDASAEWTDVATDEMLSGEDGSVRTEPAADSDPRTGDDAVSRPGTDAAPRSGTDAASRSGTDDVARSGTDDVARLAIDEELADRLAAVERAIGRDPDVRRRDERTAIDRVSDVESRLETIERRLDELDAAVQALRGYAGSVRAVEETIERRADLALATARKAAAAVDATEAVEPDAVDDALPTEAAVAAAIPDRGEGNPDREPVLGPESNGPEGAAEDGVLTRLRDVL